MDGSAATDARTFQRCKGSCEVVAPCPCGSTAGLAISVLGEKGAHWMTWQEMEALQTSSSGAKGDCRTITFANRYVFLQKKKMPVLDCYEA